jgi:hypothetical protein
MPFFVVLIVFAVGFGLYAVAALVFDRRRSLRAWRAARVAGDGAGATGGVRAAAVRAVTALPPSATIAGCLVGGTTLMLGSCAGLIAW